MKIIKLEQDRVKVILSEDDLAAMNIDASAITPDSAKLSLFMCEVMEAVKAQTGFSAEKGQVIVDATSSDGGMVLILSKRAGVRLIGAHHRKNEYVMFEFSDFDALSGLLVNIDTDYAVSMRLYKYKNRFYMAVPRRRIPILIYEYSLKNRRSPVAESVVSEYGRLLAGGYKLADIVSDLKKM